MNIKTDVQIGIAVSGALVSLALKNIGEMLAVLVAKIRGIFSRNIQAKQEVLGTTRDFAERVSIFEQSDPESTDLESASRTSTLSEIETEPEIEGVIDPKSIILVYVEPDPIIQHVAVALSVKSDTDLKKMKPLKEMIQKVSQHIGNLDQAISDKVTKGSDALEESFVAAKRELYFKVQQERFLREQKKNQRLHEQQIISNKEDGYETAEEEMDQGVERFTEEEKALIDSLMEDYTSEKCLAQIRAAETRLMQQKMLNNGVKLHLNRPKK